MDEVTPESTVRLLERGTGRVEGRVTSPRPAAPLSGGLSVLQQNCNSYEDTEVVLPGQLGHGPHGQPHLNLSDCSNISIGGTQTVSVDNGDKGQHIIARSRLEIQRRVAGMIRTKAYLTVLRNIQKGYSWTIISGCPGEGKTTLGYFVLKYFEEKSFDVYIIKSKEEYFNIREFGPKTALMLNDIFGAFAFDSACLDHWQLVLGDLEHMAETQGNENESHFHVVMTMRNYVLKTALPHLDRHSRIFDNKDVVIDLTASFPLNRDEKKDILRCHLKRKQVRLEQEQTTVEKICELPTVHGFPHCCQMFSDMKAAHKDPIKFFSRPLIFLNNATKKFMQNEKVRKLFYALLLKDGSLPIADTDPGEFLARMTRDEIIDASGELLDSYLIEHNNILCISHPSILWSVVYVIGCRDPEFLIKVCPLNFINELVILPNTKQVHEEETSTHKIELRNHHTEKLQDRFVEEIESNKRDLQPVLSHVAFSCEEFAEQFLSRMTQKLEMPTILALTDEVTRQTFIRLVTSNKSEILLKLITRTHQFTEREQKYVLLGCCEFGSAKAFIFLTDKYPQIAMNVADEYKRSPLSLAAKSGNKDIVKLLLPKVDIHARDIWGMTALHCSLEGGQAQVACFLVENGMDVNSKDSIGRSPLHYAAWGGHQNVVCFLLQNGSDVNITDKDDATALHDASFRGFGQVTETLIKAGSDINKHNAWRETPLCVATTHGHRAVVRWLVRSGCDKSLKNGKGQTAEDIARLYGHEEIVEILGSSRLSMGVSENLSKSS